MSFDHGAHCPKIGALVHIQILIVELKFPFLYTDSIDILNSLKVSFLWKNVCAMSRVKKKLFLDILGTLFYN